MRDCENCIHRKENGCEVWECEFSPKKEKAVEEIPYEEVTAIEFSADIDKPSKVQTKDGEWHENCFITGIPK